VQLGEGVRRQVLLSQPPKQALIEHAKQSEAQQLCTGPFRPDRDLATVLLPQVAL
jgi:hypothetical protein